jgi:hypothetical protein
MAKKKTPPKSNRAKPSIKKQAKKLPAKKTAGVPPASLAAAAPAVPCVNAVTAQNVMNGCMSSFGIAGVSKGTQIGAALPGRANAFCSCIRNSSGVTNASCNGSMTFQQVEIGLVCP